jgi:cell division protein FtsB
MAVKRKLVYWSAVAGFLLVVLLSFTGDQNVIALYRSHLQIRQGEAEIEQSRRIIDSLKTEIEHLKNDTAYIERIARERLGMAKKNEKIYKFVGERDK